MSKDNGNKDPQAGDREAIKASEEVIKRNIISMMSHSNQTRQMVLELAQRMEALQTKMMAMDTQQKEMIKQLSVLQGEFYKRGTTSYADAPIDEEEQAPREGIIEDDAGGNAEGARISFP